MDENNLSSVATVLLPTPQRVHPHRLVIGVIALIATACAGTIGILHFVLPPATPASPMANNTQPAIVRQSLATADHETLAYYLAASQKYLTNARDLSHELGANQTASDKQKIIDLLNSSLQMANDAVLYFPSNPEGFANRADLLDTVAAIDPSVKGQADTDRGIAAKLGSAQAASVKPTDIIQAEPLQEAALMQNVAIALPDTAGTAPLAATGKDNALKGTVTIKAGQTDVTVASSAVAADRLVYFTPETTLGTAILNLSSKNTCGSQRSTTDNLRSPTPCNTSFTLHLDRTLTKDTVISWWIVE